MTFKAQLQPILFHDSVVENCYPTLQTCILKNLLLGHFWVNLEQFATLLGQVGRRVPDLRESLEPMCPTDGL